MWPPSQPTISSIAHVECVAVHPANCKGANCTRKQKQREEGNNRNKNITSKKRSSPDDWMLPTRRSRCQLSTSEAHRTTRSSHFGRNFVSFWLLRRVGTRILHTFLSRRLSLRIICCIHSSRNPVNAPRHYYHCTRPSVQPTANEKKESKKRPRRAELQQRREQE